MLDNQQINSNWPTPSSESELIESAMDKNRDDTYLMGPGGVTRRADLKMTKWHEEQKQEGERSLDGFHNKDRSVDHDFKMSDPGHLLEEEFLKPDLRGMTSEDIQLNEAETSLKGFEKKSKNTKKQHRIFNKQLTDEIKTNHAPRPQEKDITKGRSNSSANTTSPSALTSSVAKSKDTKKL